MAREQLQHLTQDQVDQFDRDGYLCIPGFLSPEEVAALLARSKQIVDEFNIDEHPKTKFSSKDIHVGDEYFLTSGDKIRYFLDEGAVDDHGNLTREKEKSVNKIGHALHELDPTFKQATLQSERIKAVVRDLGLLRDPAILQSMVIMKQPRIGAEVRVHNDSTFLYTDPPSALGFWFALEKCTAENGALSFIPGSHKTTPITRRFVRLPQGGTGYESTEAPKVEGKFELVTCEPGDLVLIHGSVLHKSEQNASEKTRFAYTFHMIESPPHAVYDERNWLQPSKEMPFSKLLAVA